MKRYELPINLAELMKGGYKPKAGDVVYDTGYGHWKGTPTTRTGSRHGTYNDLIGHSTQYDSQFGYHLPKFYEQYREAILVSDVVDRLKAIPDPEQQHAECLLQLHKLINELTQSK